MSFRVGMILAVATSLIAATNSASFAEDVGLDQVGRANYLSALKGKKVIFIPVGMGVDIAESWVAVWRKQASKLGYSFDIKDPNWNTDAGSKAFTSALAEKPDLILVQNPDLQTYSRLLKRAQESGIKVMQMNMQSVTLTDSYVGVDWVQIGEEVGKALAAHCSAGKGPSTKVAYVQGVVTGAPNLYQLRGLHNILSQHPEIQVVSDQAANYDPAKARSIMETVLQQHPDLCGAAGVWDSQDAGIGAAVNAAGKTGQVLVVTSGAGSKNTCDNLEKGLVDVVVDYDTPLMAEVANQQIAELLQNSDSPGSRKTVFYTPLRTITKSDINPRNCWTMDDLK